jgi:hypothetical protein
MTITWAMTAATVPAPLRYPALLACALLLLFLGAPAQPARAASGAATRAQVKSLQRQVRQMRALLATLQQRVPHGQVAAAPADLSAAPGGIYDGDLQVKGRLSASGGSGVAFNADGNLDGRGGADPNPYRVGLGVQAINGSNGPRGDSILNDTANSAGASFFAPFYLNSDFRTEGSLTGYTAYVTVNQTPQGNQYGEAMPFYGGVVTSRAGALTSGAELQNTVTAGSPARATGANIIVNENNPLSAYGDQLRGTAWASTGSRGVDVISQGSQPVGVGLLLRGGGGFARAIALDSGGIVPFAVGGDGQVALTSRFATASVLQALVSGEPAARLAVSADGRLVWGDGHAPGLLSLERLGQKTLHTNGRLVADGGLGVGNSRRAKRAGKLVRKMAVYDRTGHRLGYVPIYR